ncbi:MAG: hypothetical protein C0615_09435, partial [Desulfuromonas sp.]
GYGTELKETIRLLHNGNCRSILGNHDLWWLEMNGTGSSGPADRYLRTLPVVVERDVYDQRIVMVHGSPPASLMDGIKLLDEDGELIPAMRALWQERLQDFSGDVLVVGHTHQVFAERLGKVLVVNPGSTCFNHTCAILTLPECTVDFFPLGGQEPEPVWNWGLQYRR